MTRERRVRHPRPAFRARPGVVLLALGAALAWAPRAQAVVPPGGLPREHAPASLTQAELAGRVRTLAESLSRQDRFSGVILLAHEGRKFFEAAYGYADREARRRMTVGSSINVSSVGKLFTQVAIGQLVAAGKLSLDSTIAAYWPDYPDPVAARKVTIRHLLAHQSGLAGDIFRDLPSMRRNRDYVPAATQGPLAFEPGTRSQYSNAGYVVLGEIIERVSTVAYGDYIRRHVLAPAGMTATGFPALEALPRHAAVGYTSGFGPAGGAPAPRPPMTRAASGTGHAGSAAGGSYSTVNDLLRFVVARRQGRLGVPARRTSDRSQGGSPGSNAVIAEGLPGGYDLIVLANVDPPVAESVADSVMAWLQAGATPRSAGAPTAVPDSGRRVILRAPGDPDVPPPSSAGPTLPALPDTPQGRAAAGYFRAFSSGDDAALRTVFETLITKDHRTTAERVRRSLELFAEFGSLTVVGVRVAPDGSYEVDVRSGKVGPMTAVISFEAVAPHRITTVGFRVMR